MNKYKKNKIEKYNFEEIVLILLILTSDLSRCSKEDMNTFNEAIEGRIEVLFNREFLLSLGEKYGLTNNSINELEDIKDGVLNLYESQWMKKLLERSNDVEIIKNKSQRVLSELRIESSDPKKFLDENLQIDW